ncbi:MAG: hypothetical protein AAF127_08815 [Pseudomonadota bacterium]
MKYDDASWHYGGNFPKDLPESAGATHIGMFVAWALLNGLAGNRHEAENAADLVKLRERRETPGAWFIRCCDEKFIDQDLSRQGNAFARAYYGNEKTPYLRYIDDYSEVFATATTLYHVPDTWQSYDRLALVISSRYQTFTGG